MLAWASWLAGLVAVLRPHPIALTVVRTGAALVLAVALASAATADVGESALALAATAVLLGVAIQPRYGELCIDARSYGDERRFGLRMPPLLLAGPLPLAVAIVGAGAVAGPLLLADRRWVLGGVLTAVGLPLAALAARSLHSLSDRFVVLVPNGLVLHDPMTMGEPVLFLRALVGDLAAGPAPGAVPAPTAGPAELLDLRAGASAGAVTSSCASPSASCAAAGASAVGRSWRRAASCSPRAVRPACSRPPPNAASLCAPPDRSGAGGRDRARAGAAAGYRGGGPPRWRCRKSSTTSTWRIDSSTTSAPCPAS